MCTAGGGHRERRVGCTSREADEIQMADLEASAMSTKDATWQAQESSRRKVEPYRMMSIDHRTCDADPYLPGEPKEAAAVAHSRRAERGESNGLSKPSG